jgi:putative membrane protein
MRPHGHGGGGGWSHGWLLIFPTITMILFWAVLLLVVILLGRAVTGRSRWAAAPGHTRPWPGAGTRTIGDRPPEQLLAARLASGEIDVEEFHHRMDALKAASAAPPPMPTQPPAPPTPPPGT